MKINNIIYLLILMSFTNVFTQDIEVTYDINTLEKQ